MSGQRMRSFPGTESMVATTAASPDRQSGSFFKPAEQLHAGMTLRLSSENRRTGR